MRKNVKWAAILVACMLTVGSFSGCGQQGSSEMTQLTKEAAEAVEEETKEDVKPLQAENEIPANGFISKAQMDTIAGKKGTYRFHGETENGIEYQWTYDGNKIQNPVEQKLLVECSEDDLDEVKKAAANAPYAMKVILQNMEMAAPAELTLTLNEVWNADKVLYCTYEDGKVYKLDDAKIESGEKASKISFTVTKAGGDFYLLGGSTTGKSKEDADTKDKNATKDENAEKETDVSSLQTGANGETEENNDTQDDSTQAEPENNQTADNQNPVHTCTISIECSTILNNWDDLRQSKAEFVPSDGWILYPSEVEYTEGETVFDVLKRVCNDVGIHMASRYTPMYGSYYIEGINQLYEFDCGQNSGWMYCVNGWFPNYGCSSYTVEDGDVIEWRYTCDLGSDVGNTYTGGE